MYNKELKKNYNAKIEKMYTFLYFFKITASSAVLLIYYFCHFYSVLK